MSSRVREVIEQSRTPAISSETVARALFISRAHLRRLLAAEGTSFRSLRDEHRTELAIRALGTGRPVDVLSRELGFSDRRAFRRAFKRWTGDSPTSARRSTEVQRTGTKTGV
ncbi:helix-turn-helix transcriptional regulator [Rhodococcus fascians]|nr:helix-turn-helix transcriptional regulator [Rhodococcus fascians]MBY4237855.1 helix-turn-helix transcriptional regulator [Rhodococcus fascians]MBY4253394.1 helix-turn-helix transcriptional regulator [Rhodococcus fascians]MBY4269031.1 helix-turn-helix transcriptional regulator [Rhodococcus fascians]MBY4275084.1 helix-turn-helix transcriptional regulator [Rhodococcus fascians]